MEASRGEFEVHCEPGMDHKCTRRKHQEGSLRFTASRACRPQLAAPGERCEEGEEEKDGEEEDGGRVP